MARTFISETTQNVTKADLVEHLANELKDLTPADCKHIVEAYFEVISEALVEGRNVRIKGLGSFEVRQKRERPGRNVHTGEEVMIEARRVVMFHPAASLRERVTTTLLRD